LAGQLHPNFDLGVRLSESPGEARYAIVELFVLSWLVSMAVYKCRAFDRIEIAGRYQYEQKGNVNHMRCLHDVLQKAQENGVAIGHFNVSDLVLLKAVFGAARELNVPVLVGLSEGEREFVGARQIAALVRSLREEFDFPIFLNADHTHSLAKGIEAAKAGFDSIVYAAPSGMWIRTNPSPPSKPWTK